ncbi:complement factor H-like [Strix uralensis]|uniref:complement factor H-like n=1 Tax=Strix uralensis TaxID=36305 RepID=UPI003DA75126
MTLLSHTIVVLLWMGCTTCRASTGAACEDPPLIDFGDVVSGNKSGYEENDRVQYMCNPGYTLSGSEWVTCHEKIWVPGPPQCLAPCTITKQQLEAQNLLLSNGQRRTFLIQSGQWQNFKCMTGFKLSASSIKQCVNGHIEFPSCITVAKCLPVQAPENGRIITTGAFELGREYSFGQVVNFECNAKHRLVGSKEIICSSNGKWNNDVPQCQEINCDVPKIPHGYIRSPKRLYKESEQLQFFCDEGYRHGERADAQCTESGWNPIPYCTEIVCSPPIIPNGSFRPQEDNYVVGDIITVQCNTGYHFKTLTGKSTAECTRDGWVPVPGCVQKPCDYPAIENGKLSGSLEYHKNYYFPMRVGQHVDYQCANGYSTPSGHSWVRIVCSGRGWSPEPKCLRKGGKCGPPPVIENGELLSFPMQEYPQGSILEYKCPSLYVLEGSRRITCTDGQWTSPPVCLAACTASEEDMGRNNIELKWVTARKLYSRSGDFIEFRCKRGYMADPESPPFRAQCMKGTLEYPQCKPGKNCTVLKPIMERNNIQLQSSIWSSTYTYQTGDTILFECKWWYRQVSHPEKFRPECVDGEINYPTCELQSENFCEKTIEAFLQRLHNLSVQINCCVARKVEEEIERTALGILGHASTRPSLIFEEIASRDKSGQEEKVNVQTNNKNLCTASTGAACEDPPLIDFGDVVSGNKSGYEENDRVQYMCNPGYTLSGSEWVTCHEKIWVPGPPQCLAPCTITKQQLEAQNLLLSNGQRRTFLIQSGQWQNFKCMTGFKLSASSIKQCVNGHIEFPSCITERPCLPPEPVECADVPRLENQNLQIKREGKTFYLSGAKFKYVSRRGYKFDGLSEITCSKGKWTSAPACLEMPCESIPKVANAQTEGRNKEIYEPGETIRYQCDAGFLIVGPPEIICREGNWTAPPFCEDVTCGAAPEIPNAYITSTQQERYLPGARLQYECESHFQMTGGNYVTCTNGEWSQAPTCRDVTCEPPPEIPGGKVKGVKKSRYLPGESAHYQCWPGFVMAGASSIACQNGNWTKLPNCKGRKCGPPPVIENGELLSFPMQEYPQGSILEYRCPSLYVLEGSRRITCTDGQWTSPPVCLVACTASEEDMGRNNIELKWVAARKLYTRSGDFIEFRCKRGYMVDPASPPFRAQCMKGTLEYPQCKPGRRY